jgi:hypothetical protein
MKEPWIYDKAKYHIEGDWPNRLPEKQAYVFTGLFLGWLIDRELYSREFAEDWSEEIRAFNARKLTGPEIYRRCDGALVDDMLSRQGNAFARAYFDFSKGKYLDDFNDLLGGDLPTLYHVKESWKNYDLLCVQIDKRYSAWLKRRAKTKSAGTTRKKSRA